MKKLVLILIAGASFATANAQIQFGVKAGANFANITGDGTSGYKSLVGLDAGVFANIPLAQSFSFSPEIIYSGKGTKFSDAGIDFTGRANYLDIPLLFKYKHASGFNVETGPQVGFLLSAQLKAQGQSQDQKAYFNTTEFAWDLGIGYDIPKTPVGIEVRYNLGISNIAKADPNDPNDNFKQHNSVFQVGLRYTLLGGKK
ncbi:MAG TPA: porin family protein [Puia sp.]|nr:porin family protein [Puia sp.]